MLVEGGEVVRTVEVVVGATTAEDVFSEAVIVEDETAVGVGVMVEVMVDDSRGGRPMLVLESPIAGTEEQVVSTAPEPTGGIVVPILGSVVALRRLNQSRHVYVRCLG